MSATGLPQPFPPWTGGAVFLVAIALSIPLHAALGMDSAWDTANYHLYIGWAAATRHFYDLGAVAQYRAYLNPVLDLCNYLAFSSHALAGAALHSIFFALDACLVFLLARQLCADQPHPRVAVATAVAIGLTGAMTISLFGTWTNEHQTALPVLLGLLLLLRAIESGKLGWVLWAGVLFGAAAGLKLTALSYAVGALAVAAAGGRPRFSFTLRFCAGLALGFLLVEGPFLFLRWEATGNPTFPFFNNVFKSPNFPPVWSPETWGPIGGLDLSKSIGYLALPFTWLAEGATSEAPTVRDGRFLLGYVGLAMGAAGIVRGRKVARVQLLFFAFFSASFVIWIVVFHIYRYLVALEMLTGLVFVVGCQAVFSGQRRTVIAVAVAGVALFLGVVTVYPDWGRRSWSRDFARSNLAGLAEARRASTIYFADQRLTYLAPLLHAEGLRFRNLFSQQWWDGARHSTLEDNDATTDMRSTFADYSDRIAFLQYSTVDVREKSPFLAERFRGKPFACVPVETNMIWNPYLCFFGNTPGR